MKIAMSFSHLFLIKLLYKTLHISILIFNKISFIKNMNILDFFVSQKLTFLNESATNVCNIYKISLEIMCSYAIIVFIVLIHSINIPLAY